MKRIITNWENDVTDIPETKVTRFVNKHYPEFEFKMLSALKHRTPEELSESLKESYIIIMYPHILDRSQIVSTVSHIAHWIHVGKHGAYRMYDIDKFIFITDDPYGDLRSIWEWFKGVQDSHGENPLMKLLNNCEVHFYGFENEHYEMKSVGYWVENVQAIRWK